MFAGGNVPPPIVLTDMRDRQNERRSQLLNLKFALDQQKRRNNDLLDPALQKQLDEANALLEASDPRRDQPLVIDPLFVAVQQDFRNTGQEIRNHIDGKLPSQQAGDFVGVTLSDAEKAFAAAYGILERESQTNPDSGRRFSLALANARGEYNGQPLFDKVLDILVQKGEGQVDASQWAAVVKSLATQRVAATSNHLELKTTFALAGQEGVNDNAPPSSIGIDLPDLDSQTNVEIVVDNILATQGLHFASMFDEVNGFKVMDQLVANFSVGQLPLGRGTAGDALYAYWKKSVNRLTEIERRNIYARTFGMPGGDPTSGKPNGEFADLFMRFMSAVSSFSRQLSVDDLIRANIPAVINQEGVKKAGRDLAGNLSLHGYGIAYFAATELQQQIKEIIAVLSDDEVRGAYGAKDMWGVIDSVATLELGSSRNTVKYRTMATAGATIIKWLADHASDLTTSSRFTILSLDAIRNPPIRPAGQKPTTNPTDRDLVDACEAWLAVTGTPDASVEQYAQPAEGPAYTSAPIRMPQVAQDLLDSVGVKPMSYVNGKARGASA